MNSNQRAGGVNWNRGPGCSPGILEDSKSPFPTWVGETKAPKRGRQTGLDRAYRAANTAQIRPKSLLAETPVRTFDGPGLEGGVSEG
jgi:hypothetical protein